MSANIRGALYLYRVADAILSVVYALLVITNAIESHALALEMKENKA